MKNPEFNAEKKLAKGLRYISKLSNSRKEKLISILKEVKSIQTSELTKKEKVIEIKRVMWTNQSTNSKLFIGGFIGAITGLFIFGTGGVGITALGGGVGLWGWFTTAAGGAFIASLIQNFENKNKK